MLKIIIVLFVLGSWTSAQAFFDPWTDCNQWGDDAQTIILCRRAKIMRYRTLQNQTKPVVPKDIWENPKDKP